MFSFHYNRDFKYFNDNNEIIFNYTKNPNLDLLKEVSETNKIVIDVTEEDNDKWLSAVKVWSDMCGGNLSVRLTQAQLIYYKDKLQAEGIKYFITTHIRDWDGLSYIDKMGASEVYITDSFGFELRYIMKYCKERNITVRIYPNIAQMGYIIEGEDMDIRSFFVRPEDIYLYEGATFEFFGPIDRYNVLYEIYKSGHWDDSLDVLIIGLNTNNMYNSLIPNEFGIFRLDCGKKCYKGKCILCEKVMSTVNYTEHRIKELAEAEKENN